APDALENVAGRGLLPRSCRTRLSRGQERDRLFTLRGPQLRRIDAAHDPLSTRHDPHRRTDRPAAGGKIRRSPWNKSRGRSTPSAANGNAAVVRSRPMNLSPKSFNTTKIETWPQKNHDSDDGITTNSAVVLDSRPLLMKAIPYIKTDLYYVVKGPAKHFFDH